MILQSKTAAGRESSAEQKKVAGEVREMVDGPVRRRWVGGSRHEIMLTPYYYDSLHVTIMEREF